MTTSGPLVAFSNRRTSTHHNIYIPENQYMCNQDLMMTTCILHLSKKTTKALLLYIKILHVDYNACMV
ncbi:hypothetical protein EB796_021719 [Bugula neritina]|uniref:Uncharacterized protein n=1 Tax=Bugula neritina TaxID=10212 RepID=A0A7J7J2D2_BUGNE|nr:hypothetical protein EB796_021719 [Bugula neritina]